MKGTEPRVFAWEINYAVFCELKIALSETGDDGRSKPRGDERRAQEDIQDGAVTLPIPGVTSLEEAHQVHAEGEKVIIPEMSLLSENLGLQGRPDLLIWDKTLDFFEFKTGPAPERPSRRLGTRAFESDAAQALAYGLLIEERFGLSPSLWIVYGESSVVEELRIASVAWGAGTGELERHLRRAKPIHVPFNEENRAYAEELITRVRAIKQQPQDARRNHEIKARCDSCPYRDSCSERLT